jgi:deoxyadenosine/deoxycytidine kinase
MTTATTQRPLVISIEGNIGTGKSTLLANLKSHLQTHYPDMAAKILFLEEPVDVWGKFCDETGTNILEKFYKDQRRYAFTFQVMAYISRLSLLKNAIRDNPDCEIIIIERSLCADKNIFMDMLHDDGIVENIEYNIYNEWYSQFISEYRMDAVIYLDSTPTVCQKRIGRRGRDGEDAIPLDYLKKCRDYHTKWLVDTKYAPGYSLYDDSVVYTIQHEEHTYPVLQIHTNAETDYAENSTGYYWLESICVFIKYRTPELTTQMVEDANFELLMNWRRITGNSFDLVQKRLREICPHTDCVEDSNDVGFDGVVYYRQCDRCYTTWNL